MDEPYLDEPLGWAAHCWRGWGYPVKRAENRKDSCAAGASECQIEGGMRSSSFCTSPIIWMTAAFHHHLVGRRVIAPAIFIGSLMLVAGIRSICNMGSRRLKIRLMTHDPTHDPTQSSLFVRAVCALIRLLHVRDRAPSKATDMLSHEMRRVLKWLGASLFSVLLQESLLCNVRNKIKQPAETKQWYVSSIWLRAQITDREPTKSNNDTRSDVFQLWYVLDLCSNLWLHANSDPWRIYRVVL